MRRLLINFTDMSKVIVLVIACLAAFSARAQETIIRDPNAQARAVKGYHGIRVSDAIDLYLTQGQEEAVVVSAKDVKIRDRIVTEVVNGILVIRLDAKLWHHLRDNKMKAYVSFTILDEITGSGGSDIFVDGVIAGEKLAMNFSGASDFKGAIRVGRLDLEQSGASHSLITGLVTGPAKMRFSGASDLKGYELTVDDCSVKATGASDVRITVNKQLDIDASGASSLYYKGEGIVRESHSSGASSISHKG
jgi:hypothetical protein